MRHHRVALLVVLALIGVSLFTDVPRWSLAAGNAALGLALLLAAAACRSRRRRFPAEKVALRWVGLGVFLLSLRWLGAAIAAAAGLATPVALLAVIIPGNALITIGVLSLPIAPRRRGERLRAAAEGAAGAVAVVCLQWLISVDSLPAFMALPTATRVVVVAPPFLNSLTMGVVIYLASPRPGRYLGPLGILFLAACVGSLMNVTLLARALSPGGGSEAWVRGLGAVAPLLIYLAVSRPRPFDDEHPGPVIDLVGGLAPYLPAFLLLAALFWRHAVAGEPAETPVLWVVYPLVGLFLVRQLIALDDIQRLSVRLEAQVAERSRALGAAQEQLQSRRRLEALGRLAGGVAHDFNNLLTGISGYAHLIGRKAPAGAPFVAQVAHIQHAVERGAGLTRQILTFARRQPGEPQTFAPALVLRDLRRLLASIAGDGVRLELWTEDGEVHLDPGQLEQVIVNLVENARDALRGEGNLRIELGHADVDAELAAAHDAAPGAYLTLLVADDGAGMSPEVQAHLFEPFFTTKPAGEGAGLGLAASYGIVRQAGGFFVVDSAPGAGSRFLVHLPVAREARAVEAPPPPVKPSGPGRCVLLVDDTPALRESLAAALRDHAYQVLVADSGEAALELVRCHAGSIDVVVTDVRMGGMNGVATLRAIGELRPGVKGVLMSGFTDVPEAQVPRDVPFLAKPFAPPQLVQLLAKMFA